LGGKYWNWKNSGSFVVHDLAKKVPTVDPNVVQLLEQALRDVRAGKVIGAALVMVFAPGKPGVGMAGQGMIEMNTGCDMLKVQLMDLMQPRPSRILRS
jgi:hypothetical protein